MITGLQKQMLKGLVAGGYLHKTNNRRDMPGYTLYVGNQTPIRWFPEKTFERIRDQYGDWIFNLNLKTRRYTLRKKGVRRLHGGTWLKQYYLTQNKNNAKQKRMV
jgi:hypothetical protein